MTKVAAIAYNPSSKLKFSPVTSNGYCLNGAGKLFFGQNFNVLSTSTLFNFGLAGYSSVSEEIVPTESIKETAGTLYTSVVVCNGTVLSMNSGFKQKIGLPNIFISTFFTQYTCLRNNVEKVYMFESLANNDAQVYLSLAASKNHFYSFSVLLKINGSVQLIFQKSLNGENWVNYKVLNLTDQSVIPLARLMYGIEQELPVVKMAVNNEGNLIVIASKDAAVFTTNKGTSWSVLPISKIDDLHWYNDNDSMILCAVKINETGCYGTKLFDEDGNRLLIEWRKAATPWDSSKNRLDARYVAGMGFNNNNNNNSVSPLPTSPELPIEEEEDNPPIQSNRKWVSMDIALSGWPLNNVDACIFAMKALAGQAIVEGGISGIDYMYPSSQSDIARYVAAIEGKNFVVIPVSGFQTGFEPIGTTVNGLSSYGNISLKATWDGGIFTNRFFFMAE